MRELLSEKGSIYVHIDWHVGHYVKILLDDIFDKLDKNRVEQIVKLVTDDHFGQIFITDTNREHLDVMIAGLETESCIFTISDGAVVA